MLRWVQQNNFHTEFSFQLLYREFRPDPVTTVRKKKQWQQKHSQSSVTTEIPVNLQWQQQYDQLTLPTEIQVYSDCKVYNDFEEPPFLLSCRQDCFLSSENFYCPNHQTDAAFADWWGCNMDFDSAYQTAFWRLFPFLWSIQEYCVCHELYKQVWPMRYTLTVWHPNCSMWTALFQTGPRTKSWNRPLLKESMLT